MAIRRKEMGRERTRIESGAIDANRCIDVFILYCVEQNLVVIASSLLQLV